MTNVVKFPAVNTKTFSQTNYGQAFIFEGELLIGTENKNGYNAVNLRTGRMLWFASDMIVQPVDLEIIVQ